MKGERAPSESSDYEESDDERKKRRGVSGGLGRGKVMKSEEEDEEGNFLIFLSCTTVSFKLIHLFKYFVYYLMYLLIN